MLNAVNGQSSFDIIIITDIIKYLFDYLKDINECCKLLFLSKRYYYPVWSVYSEYAFSLTYIEPRSGKTPDDILQILDSFEEKHNILNIPLNIITSPKIPARQQYLMNNFVVFKVIGACIPFMSTKNVNSQENQTTSTNDIVLFVNNTKLLSHYEKFIKQDVNDFYDDMKILYNKILTNKNKLMIIEEVFNNLSDELGSYVIKLLNNAPSDTCVVQSERRIKNNNDLFDKIKKGCVNNKIVGYTRIVFPNRMILGRNKFNLKNSSYIEYSVAKIEVDGQMYDALIEMEKSLYHECKYIGSDCVNVKNCFANTNLLKIEECIKFVRF